MLTQVRVEKPRNQGNGDDIDTSILGQENLQQILVGLGVRAVRFELKMMRQLESTMQLQKMVQEI